MNMFEKLSPIYSEIVSQALSVAPADWKCLWLDTSCDESSWSVAGYWECQGSDEVIFFDVPDAAYDLVWEAWKVSRSFNDHWSTAVFRVERPGKLQITFGHEDLDAQSYSAIASQAAFRAKTFGNRNIRSTVDMAGAISLTPEMLKSGTIGP